MQQADLFDETLEKKIYRMEKWISRLQKEMWFLKQVYELSAKKPPKTAVIKMEQTDFFGT